MKRFIETLKNIWKIEDLRSRILYTLGIILIYRLGTHIVLPGINPVIISDSVADLFSVADVDGLAARLETSPFEIRRPPADR